MNRSPRTLRRLFSMLAIALPSLAAQAMAAGSPELDTLLLAASLEGNDAEVARVLAAGASPDARRDDEWTALMLAAMNGHTSIVGRLLDGGATIDLGSAAEGPPLAVAAASPVDPPEGATAIVRLLLERGADPNRGNGDGMTPLIFAAREGKADVVRALIAGGADADRADVRKWTPLRFAARGGDTATLRLLLSAHANPNVIEYDAPLTPLDHAVADGNPATVAMLLGGGADPNGFPVANGYSPSPLIRAVQKGDLDVARVLLTARANPNFVIANDDGDRLVTAMDIATAAKERKMIALLKNAGAQSRADALYDNLLAAITAGKEGEVRRLIGLGIDPRVEIVRNGETRKALAQAVASGNEKIVAALLDFSYAYHPTAVHDAYEQATERSDEPIMALLERRAAMMLAPMAAEHNDAALIERLLDRSDSLVYLNHPDRGTLLHVAAGYGAADVVELLLKRGAPIIRDAWSGRTPLYDAVLDGDPRTVSMLIAAGDSVGRRDFSLYTALHLAAHAHHPEIVAMLVAAGAPIEAVDDRGWRPLHSAVNAGDVATVAKLIELGADRTARTFANLTPLDLARQADPADPAIIEVLQK